MSGCKRPSFFGALPVLGVDYCLNGFVLPVPAIPSGFATSTLTVTGFTLIWSAATDNVAVTGYEVFRNGVSLGLTTATSRAYTALAARSLCAHLRQCGCAGFVRVIEQAARVCGQTE